MRFCHIAVEYQSLHKQNARSQQTEHRRGGRAVECTGLENRQGLVALRGFKSHPLRHINKKAPDWGLFIDQDGGVVDEPNWFNKTRQRFGRTQCARRVRIASGRSESIPPSPKAGIQIAKFC